MHCTRSWPVGWPLEIPTFHQLCDLGRPFRAQNLDELSERDEILRQGQMHVKSGTTELLREAPNAESPRARLAVPWHVPVRFDTLPCRAVTLIAELTPSRDRTSG